MLTRNLTSMHQELLPLATLARDISQIDKILESVPCIPESET